MVQDESVARFDSVILRLMTSYESDGMPTRVRVEPTEENGLVKTSYVMADKIVTVDKALLGTCIGAVDERGMALVGESLAGILGIRR